MPEVNLIPEVLYEPNQPYHYLYDNIPLKNILARINLINIQVDKNVEMLLGTAGSVGSLKNRLDESLNSDGSLKSSSVDSSLHNIAYHNDGEKDGVEYVRMKKDERSKLSLIESEANFISVQVNDEGVLSSGNIELRSSDTVSFELEAPNVIKAHSLLPPDSAHRHEYSIVPAHQNSSGSSSSSPDWKSFTTTSLSTPYMEGSLRVYINGIRIEPEGTYVPVFSSSSTPDSWMLFSISSEDPALGSFVLNSSIPYPGNSILIDFDTDFSS